MAERFHAAVQATVSRMSARCAAVGRNSARATFSPRLVAAHLSPLLLLSKLGECASRGFDSSGGDR